MPIYYGANKIHDLYFAGNSIKEMYHGSILVYKNTIPSFFETTAGEYSYGLQGGIEYLIIARGAGGAGGTNGTLRATAGKGGAGSKGKITQGIVSFPESTTATCVVGLRGMAGGGGEPGVRVDGSGGVGGYGGGAGMPSYVRAGETTAVTTMYELQVPRYAWDNAVDVGPIVLTTTDNPKVGDLALYRGADNFSMVMIIEVVDEDESGKYIQTDLLRTTKLYRTESQDKTSTIPVDTVYSKKSNAGDLAIGDEVYDNNENKVGTISFIGNTPDVSPIVYQKFIKITLNDSTEACIMQTMTPTQFEKIVPNIPVYANGGAGGGGGGGGADGQRYVPGGSGGGGGDRAYLDTDTGEVVVVKGKTGARGTYTYTEAGIKGSDGDTVNFPSVRSGGGGTARNNTIAGSAASSGAGASGGSGGSCSNHASNGGGGGGGAGGDDEAGGGSGGGPNGGTATNHYTIPKAVRDANMAYGVDTDSGIGGGSEQDGQDGFLMIIPLRKDKIRQHINCGKINETIDETIDCGFITKDVDESIDYGNYGTTIESKDYGSYGATEESEDYGKIFIPADITETINNGVIYA